MPVMQPMIIKHTVHTSVLETQGRSLGSGSGSSVGSGLQRL